MFIHLTLDSPMSRLNTLLERTSPYWKQLTFLQSVRIVERYCRKENLEVEPALYKYARDVEQSLESALIPLDFAHASEERTNQRSEKPAEGARFLKENLRLHLVRYSDLHSVIDRSGFIKFCVDSAECDGIPRGAIEASLGNACGAFGYLERCARGRYLLTDAARSPTT